MTAGISRSMKTSFTFFLLVVLCLKINAQNDKKFKLINAQTSEAIAFANIVFDESNRGTISDIDGIFYVKNDVSRLTISYLGFETVNIIVKDLRSYTISLNEQASPLEEVIITNTENPAHRIIRNVIANKAINNPENNAAFTYTSYNKIVFDSDDKVEKDSTLTEFLKDKYFFITEAVSKRKYLKPNLTEDSIIATRFSGFKNPKFAALATDFQPFSFYKEHFTLFEINYLNPIAKGSINKYKFSLEDEFLKGNDTIFVIAFEPRANRNFEGLKGLLYVNSNKYAVQNVDAEPHNQGKMKIKIQQKYTLINDEHWFPEQLNFEVIVGDDKTFNLRYTGKSYLSDVVIDPDLKRKDFPLQSLTLSKTATQVGSDIWQRYRHDTLDLREQRTYTFVDSIGEVYKFDNILKYSESLVSGRFPLDYVDIDLTKIIQYNEYEGLRLGAGLYTNDDVMKHVSVGGFAGYGFKDYEWKYGGELLIDIPSKNDIGIHLKYENNLRETGTNSRINGFRKRQFNFRNIIANQMDNIKAYSAGVSLRILRNLNGAFQFNTTDITPLYDYNFVQNNITTTNYHTSELVFNLNYKVKEKLIQAFGKSLRIDSDSPELDLTYTRGISGIFESDFNYNKLRFTLDHSFIIKNLGKMSYRLDAAYIDRSIPYGLLFTGEGSFNEDFPFVFEDYFQTATAYEFLSDRYINLFTAHNFGRLFNNKGYIKPEVVLYNNIGIGNLSSPQQHQNINFKIKNEVFLESGLELRNLIRIPYLSVGYMGLGIGGFYRYGYHHLENSDDNFVLKLSTGFTFN